MQLHARLTNCLEQDLSSYATTPFITNDMDIATVRVSSLRASIFKKYRDTPNSSADEKCLRLFLQMNDRCKSFAFEPKTNQQAHVISRVISLFEDMFYTVPDQTQRYSRSDFDQDILPGPGASLGARSYNFYTKLFDSPLSTTSDLLLHWYRSAISVYPAWQRAEYTRSQVYGTEIVEGSRLSFVPKTSEISRSICTEPSLNMLFQKGLGTLLERILFRHFRIDLSVQPDRNKMLAKLGSYDGSFGTIDLSSASDSIALNLVSTIFPRYFVNWLKIFRSPYTILPDGSKVELSMVSSMGNGFTFPLQTLIFATIVRACYDELGIKPEFTASGPKNFGVFGDDIIVRKDSYSFVVDCLSLFGFEVNALKSFNSGPFRESCGGDFYNGHDVRGVYIKSLSTRADVYSAANRLMRWSAVSGVPLTNSIKLLFASAPKLRVPLHSGDTEGFKVPQSAVDDLPRDQNGSIIYYAYRPIPRSFVVPDESVIRRYPSRSGTRKLFRYNPDGLLVSCVGGYLRDGRIVLRDEDTVRYKVRRLRTPHWGTSFVAGVVSQEHDWKVMFALSGL